MRHYLILSLLLLCSASSQAGEDFLPPEQAFQLIELVNEDEVLLQWQIADGYYLYQNRIKVIADGEPLPITRFPAAKLKWDEYFGEVGVYYQQLNLPIQPGDARQLEVHYQGCAEAGLCYPPQQSQISLPAGYADSPPADPAHSEQRWDFNLNASDLDLQRRLHSGHVLSTLLLFLLAGVVTAFAGCSYPMFPILSKIIVGQGQVVTRYRAFTLSLAYVLPIAVVYALLGVVAAYFGSNLSNWFQTPVALSAVAAILVLMALSMLGLYELKMPHILQSRLHHLSNQQRNGTYLGAVIMGTLSAFIVSACTVPPIVAAITYIAQTGDALLGASAMFLFGAGLGLPLLVLGLSASWLLPRAGDWMHIVQKLMGVFLLSAAIYIIGRFAPAWLSQLLWVALAAAVGLVLIARAASVPWRLLGGAALLIAGVLTAPLLPGHHTAPAALPEFQRINSPDELREVIANSQQPLLLDYYADWCTSCVTMLNTVYPRADIQAQLQGFKRVKIDLSQMSAAKQQLMQSQQVIGPPAILFLNADGSELRQHRITGEVDAAQFSRVLQAVSSELQSQQP